MTQDQIRNILTRNGVNKYSIKFDCSDGAGTVGCHLRFDDLPDVPEIRKLIKDSGADMTDKGFWFPAA
jgi:hypothetical protein